MISTLVLLYLEQKFNIEGKVLEHEEGHYRILNKGTGSIMDVYYDVEYRDREIAITDISISF